MTLLDGFGRVKVSNPSDLMSSRLVLGLNPIIWETVISGGGSVSYLSDESAAGLTVDTASGSEVFREQHGVNHYNPGKGFSAFTTGFLPEPQTNLESYYGLLNDRNGVRFVQRDNKLLWEIRSDSSGSVAYEQAYQNPQGSEAVWNIDRLDGSGMPNNPSGINLENVAGQIAVIDLQWLGLGAVVVGFDIGRAFIPCHVFEHANKTAFNKVYMGSADLPIRYGIKNLGATSGASLKQVCSTVQSDGGVPERLGILQGWTSRTSTKTLPSTGLVPYVAFRLKNTFEGKPNRMTVKPGTITVRANADVYVEILHQMYHLGETAGLAGGTWVSCGTYSGMEYNSGLTAFTDAGRPIHYDYITSANKASKGVVKTQEESFKFALNSAGTGSDVWILLTESLGGTATMSAAYQWKEIY